MQVVVRVDSNARNRIHLKGEQLREVDISIFHNFCFSVDHLRIKGFAERFSNITVQDDAGRNLAIQKFAPGVFDTDGHPYRWSYDVDLTALNDLAGLARVSWLNKDHGVLMIDDLLPQDKGLRAQVKLDLPIGWSIFSVEREIEPGEFDLADIRKATIFVGKGWRVTSLSRNGASVRLLIRDEWHFSDEEAATLVDEVLAQYQELIGILSNRQHQIGLSKLPSTIAYGTWTANTQGPNIIIAAADMPFKSQALQRLHEQLRHEMFHLWIPNGVHLTGNYDWFYEGFALYQSLKLGVGVNRIRFEDMLDTLGRAYDVDRQLGEKKSLVDASNVRWYGQNNTLIYARGMLVAFLCDLALLDASKGKRSTNTLVREVYAKYRETKQPQDGNTAVLSILRSNMELAPIVDQYINGASAIDWNSYLGLAGLAPANVHGATRLTVTQKPSGRQKKLLDRLGYNNWRKSTERQ